jgi:steroid 5-alpha reductase family enzyme
MYNKHMYIHYTIFLLIVLLYFWAGRLAPNLYVRNNNKCRKWNKCRTERNAAYVGRQSSEGIAEGERMQKG